MEGHPEYKGYLEGAHERQSKEGSTVRCSGFIVQGDIHDNIIHHVRVGKVGRTGTSILSNGVGEDSFL